MPEIRLSDKDWDILLPNNKFIIGQSEFLIVPLGLQSISESLEVIQSVLIELDKMTKGEDNEDKSFEDRLESIENSDGAVIEIVKMVLSKGPDLICKCSGVHKDDLMKLPLIIVMRLVVKILEVNIESKEEFLKNLKALKGLLTQFKSLTKSGDSETSSKS